MNFSDQLPPVRPMPTGRHNAARRLLENEIVRSPRSWWHLDRRAKAVEIGHVMTTDNIGEVVASTFDLDELENHAARPINTLRGNARRNVLIGVGAAVVLAGSLVGVSVSRPSSAGADAIVSNALSSTLAKSSLAFHLTVGFTISGESSQITSRGECAFSPELCGMTTTYGGALSTIGSVKTVLSRGVMYYDFGPSLANRYPTPWISIPLSDLKLSQTSTLGETTNNPLVFLTYLAQKGAVVTDDGTANVNGESTKQYLVSFSKSSAQSLVTSKLKNLPSWMTAAVSKDSIGSVQERVDVNSAGELAQVSITASVVSSGHTVNLKMIETMTGYGMAVYVTTPPASQVTPFADLSQLPIK